MNNLENRTFYYLYKITCLVNNKIYIGIHKTDNLDDGYFGSGTLLKRAIKKHGKENFEMEILQHFNSYEECLKAEQEIVTEEFIELEETYNIKTGGYGGTPSEELKQHLSECQRQNWEQNKEEIMNQRYENGHYERVSQGLKSYIANNQEEFQEKMININTNPNKISKTAEKHRGMKRSENAKKNMSDAAKERLKDDTTSVGKGKRYVFDSITQKMKRVDIDYVLKENETWGNGGSKNKGSVYVTNLVTKQIKRMPKEYQLQENEVFGFKRL